MSDFPLLSPGHMRCPLAVFDLASALGPHRLDLGDILYAPNLVKDPQVTHNYRDLHDERTRSDEHTLKVAWMDPS